MGGLGLSCERRLRNSKLDRLFLLQSWIQFGDVQRWEVGLDFVCSVADGAIWVVDLKNTVTKSRVVMLGFLLSSKLTTLGVLHQLDHKEEVVNPVMIPLHSIEVSHPRSLIFYTYNLSPRQATLG